MITSPTELMDDVFNAHLAAANALGTLKWAHLESDAGRMSYELFSVFASRFSDERLWFYQAMRDLQVVIDLCEGKA